MKAGFPREIKVVKVWTEKNKKEFKEFLKKFFKIILVSNGIITLIFILYFLLGNNILFKIGKEDILNEIYSLVEINEDYLLKSGERVFVENFNLENDTLPFRNFATMNSPSGNCEGYNMYELLHFEGKLKEVLGENMKSNENYDFSQITFSENDIENIYKTSEDKDKKENKNLNYFNSFDGSLEINIDYEEILKESYGLLNSDNESSKVEFDFNDKEFDNEDLKNILMDIEYLQNNKLYSAYISGPYYSTSLIDKIMGRTSLYYSGDIDYIKQNIDNNKLIEIAILNKSVGHSLLAYGYEKINDNNYKVYVKDSNFPLIKKDVLTEKDIQVNDDIKNNFYILFTKDILKSEWSYIYQPSINNIKLWGSFNSFVPGTKLYLYSTGI